MTEQRDKAAAEPPLDCRVMRNRPRQYLVWFDLGEYVTSGSMLLKNSECRWWGGWGNHDGTRTGRMPAPARGLPPAVGDEPRRWPECSC